MEKQIGVINHYYTNLGVAVLDLLNGDLQTGDSIHIQGFTTDLYQPITEMQINKQFVDLAEQGLQVGVKVDDRVRPGDKVLIVTP